MVELNDRMKSIDELNTILVHGGRGIEKSLNENIASIALSESKAEPKPIVQPIFQSSTYLEGDNQAYDDILYLRLSNSPNHVSLSHKISNLMGAEASFACASGMAAISSSLASNLSAGDSILCQSQVYGGSHSLLLKDLKRFGVDIRFFDPEDAGDKISGMADSTTKIIYGESISNPLMTVLDFEKILSIARDNNLISIVDNTIATPVLIKPLELGFDLEVHSATKYLNGHSDVVAGIVAGREDLVKKAKLYTNRNGGSLDPNSLFLLDRGIKTLALRVRQQLHSATEIVGFLSKHKRVKKIFFPGLEDNQNGSSYRRASKYFSRPACAMFSAVFDLPADEIRKSLRQLSYFKLAPSMGGVESLVSMPAQSSHAGVDEETRLKLGIVDNLVRFSVGIESSSDLIEDLQKML